MFWLLAAEAYMVRNKSRLLECKRQIQTVVAM